MFGIIVSENQVIVERTIMVSVFYFFWDLRTFYLAEIKDAVVNQYYLSINKSLFVTICFINNRILFNNVVVGINFCSYVGKIFLNHDS